MHGIAKIKSLFKYIEGLVPTEWDIFGQIERSKKFIRSVEMISKLRSTVFKIVVCQDKWPYTLLDKNHEQGVAFGHLLVVAWWNISILSIT